MRYAHDVKDRIVANHDEESDCGVCVPGQPHTLPSTPITCLYARDAQYSHTLSHQQPTHHTPARAKKTGQECDCITHVILVTGWLSVIIYSCDNNWYDVIIVIASTV